MLNSDLFPAAPQGGMEPPIEKPVWCPRAGASRQTGSPEGHCSHPLSRSSQTLLCQKMSCMPHPCDHQSLPRWHATFAQVTNTQLYA